MNPTTTGILIAVYALLCVIVFLIGLRQALRSTTLHTLTQQRILAIISIAIAGWMIVLHILARQNVFAAKTFPPRPLFIVLLGLIIILAISFTPAAKAILRATPLHWLVYFQVFRVGVELWFWYAYQTGVMPKLMTFEGANLDIISGVLAIVAGFLILKKPRYAKQTTIVFNMAGILILLHTLRAAALSMPSLFQKYPFDERLLLLGQPYFINLPGVLVVMALGFHILSLRQVALQSKSSSIKTVQTAQLKK